MFITNPEQLKENEKFNIWLRQTVSYLREYGLASPVDYIEFSLNYDEAVHSEGWMHWNSDEGVLEIDMPGGNVALQVGMEMLLPRRVRNNSGVNIKNGDAVYITGVSGSTITVALAQADTFTTSLISGLATEDINDGAIGWVSTYGIVRGDDIQPVDTSAYSVGDFLYLSATTPGAWTDVIPDAPNTKMFIGRVWRSHATEGEIFVLPIATQHLAGLSDVYGTAGEEEGLFWDSVDTRFEYLNKGLRWTGWPHSPGVTLSFDDGTRTFTVTDGGSAYYFIQGIRYTLGGNKTVVIPATEGTWFIYFSGDTLTTSQTPWILTDDDKAFVAYIIWDNTNSKEIFKGYELHTYIMDSATHGRLHHCDGTAWDYGLAVSDTGSDTLNVAQGEVHDEDIEIAITDGAGGSLFEQVLSPAEIPIYHIDTGNWRKVEVADKINATDIGYVSGTDLQYNDVSGAGTLANVPSANFIAMWIYATNEIAEPVVAIMGQRVDTTLANATDNNTPASINYGNSGLFQEAVLLARVIIRETGTALYYTLSDITDYRGIANTGGTGAVGANDHGALSGLNDDDHPQYLLRSEVTTVGTWADLVGYT